MSPRILGLKVLDENMQSCNGGTMAWALDKWVSVKGTISICHNGLHMTYEPNKWNGTRVFIAETPKVFEVEGDKVVCGRLRLLRELSPAAWKAYDEAKATAWKAYDEAKATAEKAYNKAIQAVLAGMLEAPKQ